MRLIAQSCLLTGSVLSQLFTLTYAEEPPSIVDKAFEPIDEAQKAQLELPTDAPAVALEQAQAYQISHVNFRGGTVFELVEISKLVEPIIGKPVQAAELRLALDSINKKYRDAGYPLSYAYLPKQDLSSGRLEIYLIEGYIARSEILIQDPDIQARVKRLIDRIINQRPLKSADFDRRISLIESTPGYRFRIVAPKPKTISGATSLRIEEVEVKNFESGIGLEDNSDEEGSLLLSAGIQSLTSRADRLTLSTLAPNNTVNNYYALTYKQDLNADGLQLEAAANHYNSSSIERYEGSTGPATLSENKNRDRLRLGINYPFLLSRSSSWWAGASLHHLNENSRFVINPESTSAMTIDRFLRYSALELESTWFMKTKDQSYRVQGRLKQGIELGAEQNHQTQSGSTTVGAENLNFYLVDVDATWKKRLSPNWQIQSKGNIFWSDDILPSAESLRYGGRKFGRGYPDAQAQGDQGYAAEIELRYFIPSDSLIVKRFEPYLVLDAATTESNGKGTQQKLSSVALGLELTDLQYYRLGLEYAQPTGDPTKNSNSHDPIYNLNLRWQF